MEGVIANSNGKIWVFIDVAVQMEILMNTDQQLSLKLHHQDLGTDFIAIFVYAKCDAVESELFDIGFKGSPFTWWNGISAGDCIFKRLDREVVNQQFQNLFSNIEVEHLSRTGSDHTPLLLTCGDGNVTFSKPFRFLNFWTNHESFKELILQNWSSEVVGSSYLNFS
ncbi:uncharacterized protein LOC132616258 [Lycium barbarum]|uniref:uncharacterized protein LOC132616258 n=1 Tax=Lycium barbarum TaxID=112863 RepID=UPI00293EF71C|nr:uncharacterized protein LOC132616258 [Lycium barbarum]